MKAYLFIVLAFFTMTFLSGCYPIARPQCCPNKYFCCPDPDFCTDEFMDCNIPEPCPPPRPHYK